MSEFRGYEMSLETAERFFRLASLWKLNTREERQRLMDMMIHMDNIKILTDDKLKKILEGKKVLRIKNEQ